MCPACSLPTCSMKIWFRTISSAIRRGPGITGLAQVSGCRGSTVEPDLAIARIDHDLSYIEKWSLRMDVAIIARTVRREFLSGSGF